MASENIDLNCISCANCNILFWITTKHKERLVASKETFYCPNGHQQNYEGKTNEQKLKEAEDEKKKLQSYLDSSRESSERYFDNWKACEKEVKKLNKEKDKKNPQEKSKDKKKNS